MTVYTLDGDSWVAKGTTTNTGHFDGNQFAISTDGNFIAGGATGGSQQLRFITYSGTDWTTMTIDAPAESAPYYFPVSVGMSPDGDKVFAIDNGNNVYTYSSADGYQSYFHNRPSGDLELGGNYIAFSGNGNFFAGQGYDSHDRYAMLVYQYQEEIHKWALMSTIPAPSGTTYCIGTSVYSASLNYNGTLLSFGDCGVHAQDGAAYVYQSDGTAWTQLATTLYGVAGDASDFGYSVALSGDGSKLVVGAPEQKHRGNGEILHFVC